MNGDAAEKGEVMSYGPPNRVRITAPVLGRNGSFELNGQTLNGVLSFHVDAHVAELTKVTVTFLAEVNTEPEP